jgi:hypothetical protein
MEEDRNMSLTIEKIDGGFVVTHHDKKQVATAENVANFIMKFWPDVTTHLRSLLPLEESEPLDDHIVNK